MRSRRGRVASLYGRVRARRGVETWKRARAATSIHPVSAMTDDRHYDLSITIVPGIAAIPSLPSSPFLPRAQTATDG